MMKFARIISAVFLFFLAFTAYSQDSTETPARPKVGVVLSGGGAKGAAHIGVLKYIEEAGIPIDYIAGTLGGVVGEQYESLTGQDRIVIFDQKP